MKLQWQQCYEGQVQRIRRAHHGQIGWSWSDCQLLSGHCAISPKEGRVYKVMRTGKDVPSRGKTYTKPSGGKMEDVSRVGDSSCGEQIGGE